MFQTPSSYFDNTNTTQEKKTWIIYDGPNISTAIWISVVPGLVNIRKAIENGHL